MATGYKGYSGYGDPERAKVDRARQLAELLQQGATDTSPKSFWEGAAQLGKAFIALDAMGKAEKAETSYAKNQERLLNHFLDPNTTADGYAMQPTINVGTDPEPEAAKPASVSPMPEGDMVKAIARALGGVYEGNGRTADIGAKQVALPPMQPTMSPGVQKIAETIQRQGGNPSLEMQQYTQPMNAGVPQIATALGTTPLPQMGGPTTPMTTPAPTQSFRPTPPAAQNRQAALRTAMRITGGNLQEAMSLVEAKYGPAPAGPEYQFGEGEGGSIWRGDKTSGEFEILQSGVPKPTNLPEGMWYGPDGKGPPQPIPGYVDMRAQIAAAGRASDGGGSAPPSGYRWNPDGSLSKIPGGPADKPEPGLYTPTEEKNFRSKAGALNTLKFLTNEYRTLVNQYGPGLSDGKWEDGKWKKTPEGQKLLAAHNNLMMFLKGPELFALGVLTGPDVERLQRTLPEPVGMGAFGQSKETLGIGLNSLDQLVGYQLSMIPEEFRSLQETAAAQNNPNFLDMASQFVGNMMSGMGVGQQRQPPMRPSVPAPRQPAPDLRNLTDEELDAMIAQGGGR